MSAGVPSPAERVEPFPWSRIEALSRASVDGTRQLLRAARRLVDTGRAASALSSLVGARVEITLRRAHEASPDRLPEGSVGVALARADEPRPEGAILIAVEPALAAALIARALGRAPPKVSSRRPPVSPELVGGLAAVLRAAAMRAHSGHAIAVLGAGMASALLEDVAGAAPTRIGAAATLTVILGEDAFTAQVIAREGALPDPSPPPLSLAELALLGPTPLGLCVVIGRCLVPLRSLRALSPGDALLTGLPSPRVGRDPGLRLRRFVGPVVLATPLGEQGICAEVDESGALVLRGERVALPLTAPDTPSRKTTTRGGTMTPDDTAPTDILGDVPLVVRVELGAAEMPASVWARIRPGDVLALGRQVGEPVILRVSGTEIAKGELVHIEGEIAVRILSRTNEVIS